jgi:uncharacterized membrane protein YoaK (UPF0700 family)
MNANTAEKHTSRLSHPEHIMMNNSTPSSEHRQTLLAIGVALIAGYLDAYALRTLGVFVSFMSGNTTVAGLRTGEGHFMSALAPAIAIPSFVAGSFAGAWITTYRKRYSHRLLFLANAILLCVILILASEESLKMINIAVLSIATGLLNPALSRVGSESISITFVTGTLSRLGRHLALAARGVPITDAEGSWDGHLRRACLDVSIWAGFLFGAVLSGMLMALAPQVVLPIPIVVMAGLGIFSRAADPNGSGGNNQQLSQ